MSISDTLERFRREVPVRLDELAKALGLQLDGEADLDPEISGQLERVGSNFRISLNRRDHPMRQRFTLAHEIGHWVLHPDLVGEGVDDTPAYRSTNAGRFFNTRIKPFHETQANQFAVWLLMPAEAVREAARETRDPRELAKRFRVTPAAMRIRLEELGLA